MATEITECVGARRIGVIKVTHRLLEDALHLPPGARILRIMDPPLRRTYWEQAEILVAYDGFRKVDDGAEPPDYRVIYERIEADFEPV
jgi:hypothetical protein